MRFVIIMYNEADPRKDSWNVYSSTKNGWIPHFNTISYSLRCSGQSEFFWDSVHVVHIVPLSLCSDGLDAPVAMWQDDVTMEVMVTASCNNTTETFSWEYGNRLPYSGSVEQSDSGENIWIFQSGMEMFVKVVQFLHWHLKCCCMLRSSFESTGIHGTALCTIKR